MFKTKLAVMVCVGLLAICFLGGCDNYIRIKPPLEEGTYSGTVVSARFINGAWGSDPQGTAVIEIGKTRYVFTYYCGESKQISLFMLEPGMDIVIDIAKNGDVDGWRPN